MRLDEGAERCAVPHQRLEREIAVPPHGEDRRHGEEHERDRREPPQPQRPGRGDVVERGRSLIGAHDPSGWGGRSLPKVYTGEAR